MNAATQGDKPFDIKAQLEKIKSSPLILLILASSIAIVIIVALFLWAKTPNYDVLFSNVESQDGGAIVQQLEQMNIPFQFTDNGSTILVPSDVVFETRMKLAQAGLPRGGSVGFELLDRDNFGISQFTEQVNYQRALEGELARTIESLNSVVKARVHLAIPKPSIFVRQESNPSASITLTLHSGRTIDESQINAIVYLVSGSVSKLSPDNVTIVDQNGRLLTNRSGNSGLAGNAEQLRIIEENEQRLTRNIENILAPVVGNGNVRAQVTLDMDFAVMEFTQENYGPNQPPNNEPAVRSRQISQNNALGADANAGGIPGALSNQPTPIATAPITPQDPAAQDPNAPTNEPQPPGQTATETGPAASVTRRDETINFEVDRTIRHSKEQVGKIQRITVAVVVNYIQDENGEKIPLTDAQKLEIENLVKQSVGFDDQRPRPDQLVIVNTPFANLEPVEQVLPIWQQQRFIDLAINVLRYLLVLIVAFILWRKLVKPFIAKRTKENENIDAQTNANANDDNTPVNFTSDGSEPIILQPISGGLTNNPISSSDFSGLTSEDLVRHKRSQQRVTTEVKIQRIRDLSDKDPRVVALVIRQWITNNE